VAAVVVLLRGDGVEADRRRTVDALERNTSNLDICFFDANEADSNSKLKNTLSREHEVLVIGSGSESGAVTDRLAWEVVQQTPEADVVLLEVGSAVGPRWCEQLRNAAYADAVIATSSAVPAHMLALHDRPSDLRLTGDSLAGPAMGEPLWGCVYVRREALNIANGARWSVQDREDTPPLRLEEFVLVPGLVHVLAAAVVTRPPGQASEDVSPLTPAIRRALATIEAAIEPLRVTVDLRCCAYPFTGTQVHALNLVASLARLDELRLSVLIPARVHDSVQPHLDALPPHVIRHTEGRAIVPSPHVFHRPYQLFSESEITGVVTSGTRLVVTHQDMILDRTPAYFPSRDEWRHYTARTAFSFVAADEVAFFSEHAREEAVRDGLIEEQRTSVIPPGTDHLRDTGDGVMPAELRGRLRPDVPFVFVIGNAYFHKNRLFALRVSEELRKVHDWEGVTVFAGGDPGAGSSGADENEFLSERRELSTQFVDLRHVSDAERHWLYTQAALVLFPTLYEGFGLVPFEAAAAGTPCVYSGRSSVAEFLPSDGALLELGDVGQTARRLHTVLESREASEAIVRAIRLAGAELTWRRTADSYVGIYRRAMTRPVGLSLALGRELVVAPSTQMISSNTERRVLLMLRRNRALRLIADVVVGVASAARRVVRRFSRV
jgi:glycosyltransferase involved in cell wall biosynthesis